MNLVAQEMLSDLINKIKNGQEKAINDYDDTWDNFYLVTFNCYDFAAHGYIVRSDNAGSALDEVVDWLEENGRLGEAIINEVDLPDFDEDSITFAGNHSHLVCSESTQVRFLGKNLA